MRNRKRAAALEEGFTLIELLIVVAIIGIIAAIAIPNLLQARKRSEFSALMAEARNFQNALILYGMDNGQYPLDSVLDRTTLEPLVSAGYLESNSFVRNCRDSEIHSYKFDPGNNQPLEWHFHPRMKPYDDGAQKIRIEGNGSSLIITYLGQTYDPSSILPLIN